MTTRHNLSPEQADLLFNATPDAVVVTQAAVVFDDSYETAWPLDELNMALAHGFGCLLDDPSYGQPQIYPVDTYGSTVGFVVMPRNDGMAHSEALWDGFWEMLVSYGHAIDAGDRYDWVEAPPFFCPGEWHGTQVGIVAYPMPYGAKFPYEPVNAAIRRIIGQPLYPLADFQPFLYPIRKENSDLTSGLLLSERRDNADLDPDFDDNALRHIRDLSRKHKVAGFEWKRFYLR